MRLLRDGTADSIRPRRALRGTLAVTLAVTLGTIGLLAASALAGSSAQSRATIALRSTKLGSILVDARGRTLYLFAKDRNGRSSCARQCAAFWPPLIAHGKPTVGPGLNASLVRVVKRANGAMQVTYNRHPLYTYAEDERPGQTRGQGESAFGAKWYAVSAKGRAVIKASAGEMPTMPDTTTSTSTTPYPTYP